MDGSTWRRFLIEKKIVGYKFGRKMTVDLVVEALDHAVQAQNPAPGLIIHTELGTQ